MFENFKLKDKIRRQNKLIIDKLLFKRGSLCSALKKSKFKQ